MKQKNIGLLNNFIKILLNKMKNYKFKMNI